VVLYTVATCASWMVYLQHVFRYLFCYILPYLRVPPHLPRHRTLHVGFRLFCRNVGCLDKPLPLALQACGRGVPASWTRGYRWTVPLPPWVETYLLLMRCCLSAYPQPLLPLRSTTSTPHTCAASACGGCRHFCSIYRYTLLRTR